MLKQKKQLGAYAALALLTGCASYHASTLSTLPQDTAVISQSSEKNVAVSWKTFDRNESELYLGRDVAAEGYVPVQVTIWNNSSDPLYLNPLQFNIVLPSPSEVAGKVHTSTAGRVVGWGVPGLFLWPFLIPAVYDGIQSSHANSALDADYQEKAIKEKTIQPKTHFNGVIFVPKEKAKGDIEMFLLNQRTQEKLVFSHQQNS